MEIRFRPIKPFPRLHEPSLDLLAAFAIQPDEVRNALLEAIRCIQIPNIDITLLKIESAFWSTLNQPWKEPFHLRPVLEACRQGKLQNRTERLFFEYGKEYGIAALSVATRPNDHKLFREIDQLPNEEIIKLVKNIEKIPKRVDIVKFVEGFNRSRKGHTSHQPQLPRPRTRKKDANTSQPPTPPSLSNSQDVSEHSKKRRLSPIPITSNGIQQQSSSSVPQIDQQSQMASRVWVYQTEFTQSRPGRYGNQFCATFIQSRPCRYYWNQWEFYTEFIQGRPSRYVWNRWAFHAGNGYFLLKKSSYKIPT